MNDQKMINKEELLELAEINSDHCISIFVPTHRASEETLNGKDALQLKNQLKEVKSKLENKGMSVNEIDKFVKPINDLVNDSKFWRHQSDGLAIFLSEKGFRKYTLPVHFEEFNYLSNEFYLKPIIPVFNEDGPFYLLTLKKDEVKFYEASKHSITEVEVDDLVPSRLEDEVGYDYEQKSLQYRTQQGGSGGNESGAFHGHQDSESNDKVELMEYFRGIDRGLMKILNKDQTAPLVVCSLDSYFPIYQKVSTYNNLFPKHIPGNPADKDIFLIHEQACELLKPYFTKTRKTKQDKFSELHGTGKASANSEEIFPAAYEGKIDTLFLENRADIFGKYDPSKRELDIQEENNSSNVSLMNLLAMKVLETGGSVYLLEKDNMPESSAKVNALFRY